MTFVRKKTQVFVMLIVLIMGAALIMPAGMHLEFCLGPDGHFDISMDVCPDGDSGKMPSGGESLSSPDHHGECLDMTVACNPGKEFILPGGKAGVFKTALEKNPATESGLLAASFTAPMSLVSNQTASSVIPQVFPPHHLVSFRTIVLLI